MAVTDAQIDSYAPGSGVTRYTNLNALLKLINASIGSGGTVTSVDVSGGSTGLTFSGGPITTSGTITMAGTLALGYGGTGATTAAGARVAILPSLGGNAAKVLTVNGGATDVQWSTPTTGTVTSVSGSGGTTGLTLTGGAITTSGTLTLGGTLIVANGGTGATTAAGARVAILPSLTGNAAKVLTVNGGETDVQWSTPTTGTVTSVSGSGGTTGLTLTGGAITTSGTLTLGGTLIIANGGTGQTTAAAARVALLPSLTGNSLKGLRVNAGETDVEWATLATGTVTSVSGSGGTTGLTLTGGAITTSGTLTLGGTLIIANGGTGQTTAAAARVALLPSLTGNAGKVLSVNGGETDVAWISAGGVGTVTSVSGSGGSTGLTLTGGPITASGTLTLGGTLAIANGGTGTTSAILARQALATADGLELPLNASVSVTASASALTIALKGNDGNDPSASNPVVVPFRNATLTTSDTTVITITAALSLVVNSGATLAVVSATAFRLWWGIVNDGGTARIFVVNCLAFTANSSWTIYALDETGVVTTTAISGSSNSAGVFYTGSAATSKAFRVMGFIEYDSTGLTAGTWTTTHLLKTQMVCPGMKWPGELVQGVSVSTSTETATTSATPQATNATKAYTMTSAANLLRSKMNGNGTMSTANNVMAALIAAAGTNIGQIAYVYTNLATSSMVGNTSIDQLSKPNSTSSVTYDVRVSSSSGGTVNWPETSPGGYGTIELQEIMV